MGQVGRRLAVKGLNLWAPQGAFEETTFLTTTLTTKTVDDNQKQRGLAEKVTRKTVDSDMLRCSVDGALGNS